MRRLLFTILFLISLVAPSQAASYIDMWPSGDWVYAQAVTEQNFQMPLIIHTQRASVTLSGHGRYASNSQGFTTGTAIATVALPLGDDGGSFVETGVMEVFCTRDNRLFSTISANRGDRFGTSYICTHWNGWCSPPSPGGFVTCGFVPLTGCNVKCADGFVLYIFGGQDITNNRYYGKKRWRVTPAGLDCYGPWAMLYWGGSACNGCLEQSDF